MQLGELVAAIGEAQALHFREAEVTRVVTDSRRAVEGAVFCALAGEHANGADFIEDAARRGAVAAITERAEQTTPLTQLVVPDARAAMRKAAWALWGRSAAAVDLAGVTGTNGKTTTVFLLRDMIEAAGLHAGVVSTMGVDLGRGVQYTGFTTPETDAVLGAIHDMHAAEMTWGVIEISSQALSLGRVDGLELRAGVFTNLTRDHLDFHGTMDAYLDAKALMFERLAPDATAVLNRDDPAAAKLAERTRARVLWTGLGPRCDVSVSDAGAEASSAQPHPTRVRLSTPGGERDLDWHLAGTHNRSNLASAAGAAFAAGASLDAIASAAGAFRGVPGRLQQVDNDAGLRVLVDFAHTPEALRLVLQSLRSDAMGRIVCLFGCGGDRDATTRPLMGRIAADLADLVVVTSDNPRTEDPDAIIAQIMDGVRGATNVTVEADRRRAVEAALTMAKAGDTVLLAGKGHEAYQIVGDERIPFSDAQVAAEVLGAIAKRT